MVLRLRQEMACEFVTETLVGEGQSTDGIFDSVESCSAALAALDPSPDHMLWFE
jgi:hypothetical protein